MLRAFIDHEPVYRPTKRGKNNLYKLFICRALDLLAEGGHFSFITPMAVLGDDQAANLRRHIVSVGRFTGIEAFPQKDDPRKRVFPEAKLSTAVFGVMKCQSPLRFRSRVHPGAEIVTGAPGIVVSQEEIAAYDPANLTIVSCSQTDWDLSTRMFRNGRMTRTGEYCTSYQGEVNENH